MDKEIKCSLNKHSDVKAIAFCMECNKFMCNKCRQLHSDLFDDHFPSLMDIEALLSRGLFLYPSIKGVPGVSLCIIHADGIDAGTLVHVVFQYVKGG